MNTFDRVNRLRTHFKLGAVPHVENMAGVMHNILDVIDRKAGTSTHGGTGCTNFVGGAKYPNPVGRRLTLLEDRVFGSPRYHWLGEAAEAA